MWRELILLLQLLLFCSKLRCQQFPYPIHFDLPESNLYPISDTELKKYPLHLSSSSSSSSTQEKPFRVAVLSAGSIRSFGYVERSWKRYLLDPWKKYISLFVHAIALPNCQISKIGVEILHEISTEYEISYSQAPLLPYHEVVPRLPGHYSRFKEYMIQFSPTMSRGNYFDMHARRNRVYEMANNYAIRHNFEWDMFIFLRLDLALYSPRFELIQWYHILLSFNNGTLPDGQLPPQQSKQEEEQQQQQQQPVQKQGILIPHTCNFHGVCDRLAIGLPQQMKLYFQKDFVFQVLDWSVVEVPDTHTLYYPKSYMRSNGNSEHILECWFIMNSLTQLYFLKPQPLAFVTVRSAHASAYCSLNRDDYILHYPTYDFKFDPDKTTANRDLTRPASDFDLIANSTQRCGFKMGHINSTMACMHQSCQCGEWGRRRR